MTYLAKCPACNEEISGGGFCSCGYLHLNEAGQVYTQRGDGGPWQPEPNILVRTEEELAPPWEEPPVEAEPPPKPRKKAGE